MTGAARFLARLWPRSLTAQLIALTLAALLVAQGLALAILAQERERAIETTVRIGLVGRMASVKRVIERLGPEAAPAILAAASGRRIRYVVSAAPGLDPDGPGVRRFDGRGPRRGGFGGAAGPRGLRDALWRIGPPQRIERPRDGWGWRRGPRVVRLLEVTAPLRGGGWLTLRALSPPPRIVWVGPSLVTLGATAAILIGMLIWSLRRTTRPLSALADRADRLGRGEATEPLAETGPEEIRRAAAAFNGMQERLRRFVSDRTHMLGAISHDLRSPITAMRLRAELVEDAETRDALLATLAEMEAMTESALAFVREDADAEPTRPTDLGALAESVVEDAAEAGAAAEIVAAPRLVYRCRAGALKRALRNLVENAARYGGGAAVSVLETADGPVLRVEDHGPGLPPERLEAMFEPFVRLEGSRSADTGGVGLGLSIVRSIARAHGGEARLENRAEGGLRAEIRLPAHV